MRNFFKNTFSKIPDVTTKQITELLGSDEKKVIKYYRDCLKYINHVRKEVVQKTEDFIQPGKPVSLH